MPVLSTNTSKAIVATIYCQDAGIPFRVGLGQAITDRRNQLPHNVLEASSPTAILKDLFLEELVGLFDPSMPCLTLWSNLCSTKGSVTDHLMSTPLSSVTVSLAGSSAAVCASQPQSPLRPAGGCSVPRGPNILGSLKSQGSTPTRRRPSRQHWHPHDVISSKLLMPSSDTLVT